MTFVPTDKQVKSLQMQGVIEDASQEFESYAAIIQKYRADSGIDVEDIDSEPDWHVLQAKLAAWQSRNFGVGTLERCTLGAAEEVGELAHAVLKGGQGIRGMEDQKAMRAAAGDAIADATIYLVQVATILRLDFETLVAGVAEIVLERDWTKNRQDGGEAA